MDDDPFPYLPRIASPHNYDDGRRDNMAGLDGRYFDGMMGSPGSNEILEMAKYDDPSYPPDDDPSNTSNSIKPQWSDSPESSSSSDASNRHERKNSNESSALGSSSMADTPIAHGIPIPAEIGSDIRPVVNREASNQFMAGLVDFDSAPNSLTLPTDPLTALQERHAKSVKMPFRSGPMVKSTNSFTSRSSDSSGSPEAGLSMAYKRTPRSRRGQLSNKAQHQPRTSCAPSDLTINPAHVSASQFSHANPWSGFFGDGVALTPISQKLRSPVDMPYASPITTPRLHVSDFIPKARVEAQHKIKCTLDPPPEGIRKLHIQPYTAARSKQISDEPIARSKDTLEMFATVVCSSAMQNVDILEKAFARARGPLSEQKEHLPPSTDDPSLKEKVMDEIADENGQKPLNGGPVQICPGCMERELKRAERKKNIIQSEQDKWNRMRAQRTVVFNASEIIEWHQPTSFQPDKRGIISAPMIRHNEEDFPKFSRDALQIELDTRISCYCRHHEEKVGFRILFTIRDFEDNVVVQQISNSIMITDDHKNPAPNTFEKHTNPPFQIPNAPGNHPFDAVTNQPSRMPANYPYFPSQNYYPSVPHSLSAPNLPQINQSDIFSPMRTTATNLNLNLSRPASPTMPASQPNKRRKASGGIPSTLAMTQVHKLPKTPPNSAPLNAISPTMYHHPNAFNGGFSPNNAGYYPQPTLGQYANTNPPTPLNTTWPSQNVWDHRSQSMENLPGFGFSASSSALPSRGPSPRIPNGVPQFNQQENVNEYSYAHESSPWDEMPQHAQTLTNSLRSINTTPAVTQLPIIDEICPAEGSVGGGTKVSCVGKGFYKGLEVMFGDARASWTSVRDHNVLYCLTPPATQAGVVTVTFKHQYDTKVELPPEQRQTFKYVDDIQGDLLKLGLSLQNGRGRNIDETAPAHMDRGTLELLSNLLQSMASRNTVFTIDDEPRQEANKNQQISGSAAAVSNAKMEAFLVQYLEQMDLDETLGQANLNLQGSRGQTMLHLTASLGYYRVTAALLARGAHPDIGDKNGMSPLHMASLHGRVRIIRKLRAAGSDPTLRSLNGFTPADMTSSPDVQAVINTIEHRSRSQDATATPITGLSRAPSVRSQASSGGEYSSLRRPRIMRKSGEFESFSNHPINSVQVLKHSRRNSTQSQHHESSDITRVGLNPNASELETQSALTAWRDQLSMQIQHFQETVHRALPPLPNLPNYQHYPVVRRISSLVPQRGASLIPSTENPSDNKEGQYGWSELLLGLREPEPPPPYVDPPPKPREDYHDQSAFLDKKAAHSETTLHDAKPPLLRAAVESFADQQCEARFDHAESSSDMETINIGSKGLTQQEQDRVRLAYAKKVKKLRKDRNFLFIWLPLFIVFLLIALRDGASYLAYITRLTRTFFQDRLDKRVIEQVM